MTEQTASSLSFAMPMADMDEIIRRDDRQAKVLAWCKRAFAEPNGDLDEALPETRVLRFFEEAVELAQAFGLRPELLAHQIAVTYAREPGEIAQEVGGVMVTLMAFCESKEISLALAEHNEIARCNSKPLEYFQRRQKEKREKGL